MTQCFAEAIDATLADSKWFLTLTAATPVRAAARTVLAARAATVEHYLKRVGSGPGQDPEDVHQLRVATRRMTAGLSVFKSAVAPQLHRRLRRALRRLRRAAGAVRDLDVQRLLADEQLRNTDETTPGAARTVRRALERRCRQARRELCRVLPRWSNRFRQAAAELLRSSVANTPRRPRPRDNLGALGRAVLRERLNQLLAAGRAELSDLAALHQLRIAAKRLRYVMEVFAGCYPAGFRGRLYRQVESIQTELGHINDLRHFTQTLAELRVEVASRGGSPGRAAGERIVARICDERSEELRRCHDDFISQWTGRLRSDLRRQARRLLGLRRAIM